MNHDSPLRLFEGYGVELEYMIVDADTLDVFPIADRLLAAGGPGASDYEAGPIAWSNELVLHVVELKTNGPVSDLNDLESAFSENVAHANDLLRPMNARLMPSAMHPWMNPHRETKLWPHEYNDVYETFHRIFDCRGHGWSNLQSMHINLPFADDEEFARLHAAIRLVLPILPALAASSPIYEGQKSAYRDSRLNFYRKNSARIPSVAGRVIPEPIFSIAEYRQSILERMYADIACHDPEGILRHEFLNARGAIARFERNAIEIRVLDIQEFPAADLAVCRAIVNVLKALVAERWSSLREQQSFAVEPLERIFLSAIRDAEEAIIGDSRYLKSLGFRGKSSCSAADLWRHLAEETSPAGIEPALSVILDQGTLATRIVKSLGDCEEPNGALVAEVYARLCDSLTQSKPFQVEEVVRVR